MIYYRPFNSPGIGALMSCKYHRVVIRLITKSGRRIGVPIIKILKLFSDEKAYIPITDDGVDIMKMMVKYKELIKVRCLIDENNKLVDPDDYLVGYDVCGIYNNVEVSQHKVRYNK